MGSEESRLTTGISGLDAVLNGGLIPNRFYLVRGGPGKGKTTLGLHFLTSEAERNEKNLLITFQEPEEQLRSVGEAINLDLSGIEFLNLGPESSFFTDNESYDVFHPADVELDPVIERIKEAVENVNPARVFVDSMTQLRYLSPDSFQYRKQVMAFLRYLGQHEATVLFSSENTPEAPDDDLQFMSDGIINLDSTKQRGFLEITKFRGSGFRKGTHHTRIDETGLHVFPRMVPIPKRLETPVSTLPTGVPEVDQMLHGGIDTGSVNLVTGPSGIGKSTFSALFIREACSLGLKSAVFLFEEDGESYLHRTESVSMPMKPLMEKGEVIIEQIEPMDYLAHEFSWHVQKLVEESGVRVIVIDSISGFELAVGGTDLREHIHATAKNLARQGVTVIMINEVEALTGDFRVTERQLSYLTDNIILLRYLEYEGELKRTLGIFKKRLGDYERALRFFSITPFGISVGEPLTGLRGVMTGTLEKVHGPA